MAWNVGIHSYSRKKYNVHSLFEMPKEISRDPQFFVKGFNLALYKKEIEGESSNFSPRSYKSSHRDEEDIEPPFAVVGSNVTIEREEGKNVRGREYPWGVVDIENKVTQNKTFKNFYNCFHW